MIYAAFHRHNDNNHSFMRAMKNAVSTLSALLANKKDTLATLRIIMKKIIEPAKKMKLKVDWEDGVRPIIAHLRDQSNTTYLEIIQMFNSPTSIDKHDCVTVLEEIFGRMIAIGQKNLVASNITIDPISVVTETAAFTSAIITIATITGEKPDADLLLTTAPVKKEVKQVNALTAGGGANNSNSRMRYSAGSTTGTKPSVSATKEEKLKFTLSDQCRHAQRHNALEQVQPTLGDKWMCQIAGCPNECDQRERETLAEYRLSNEGMEHFWRPGICSGCLVQSFFSSLKEKTQGYTVHKINPEQAKKKIKYLTTIQKKQYDDLVKSKGVNPVPESESTNVILSGDSFQMGSMTVTPEMIELMQSQKFKEMIEEKKSSGGSLHEAINALQKPSFR